MCFENMIWQHIYIFDVGGLSICVTITAAALGSIKYEESLNVDVYTVDG